MSHYWEPLVKMRRCPAAACVAMMGLFFLLAPSAHAAPQKATYHIYAGGVRVIEAHLDLDLQKTSYHTRLVAHTRGFLGTLVPWQGSFESKGDRNDKKLSVKTHRSTSTWKGEEDSASYAFNTKGDLTNLKLRKDGQDEGIKLDPTLTRGVTDILSASLMAFMNAEGGGKCQGSTDIFDSKRRFTLKFAPVGAEVLKKSRYTPYQGQSVKCTAEVIPKGGAWHKKPRGWLSIQEQGRSAGMMPTLWVAKVSPDLPPLPVKIRIKTDYGTLFMHLASISP